MRSTTEHFRPYRSPGTFSGSKPVPSSVTAIRTPGAPASPIRTLTWCASACRAMFIATSRQACPIALATVAGTSS